jgi:hypothetical protein
MHVNSEHLTVLHTSVTIPVHYYCEDRPAENEIEILNVTYSSFWLYFSFCRGVTYRFQLNRLLM